MFKKEYFTVPNMLSVLRILLIAPIVYLYSFADEYMWSIVLLAVSCLSDVLDGKIARKYNMITDMGKFLDVLADKLTQAALFICLMDNYWQTIILFCILAIKEFVSLAVSVIYFKKSAKVEGAKWFGKLSTMLIDTSLMAMFIFRTLPEWFVWTMVGLCVASMIFAFVAYMRFFFKLNKEMKAEKK